jgi:hypothetical protein
MKTHHITFPPNELLTWLYENVYSEECEILLNGR